MPLSENEQRILRQIEQQLERDPAFSTRGYRMPRHRLVMLSLAVLGALAVTVLALAVSVWLSLAAFAATLAAAVALEREVRLLAREKVGVLPISAWLGGGRKRRHADHRPRRRALTGSFDLTRVARCVRSSRCWTGRRPWRGRSPPGVSGGGSPLMRRPGPALPAAARDWVRRSRSTSSTEWRERALASERMRSKGQCQTVK